MRSASTAGRGGVLLGCGALGVAYLALWMKNARVLVGGDTFGFQDIFGRQRTWTAADVSAVVRVTLSYGKNLGSQQAVYVVGLDGRRLMALNPLAWDSTTIDRLARAAGKTVQVYPTPVTVAEFRREYPRAIGRGYEHPMLLGAGLGLVMIVPVFAIVGVALLLNR